MNNEISQTKVIKAGVPQGSILDPILFNLYVSDTPTTNSIAMYADDTTVIESEETLSAVIKNLQSAVNKIAKWCTKWRIKLNDEKCQTKIFTLRQIKNTDNIFINRKSIEWTARDQAIKYLGIHLDTRLTWCQHVNIKLNQSHMSLKQLFPIINKNSHVKLECAMLLFKSIIRPMGAVAEFVD